MKYDPDIHHRNSIRLRGYDYTQAGAYFVTICAFSRECLFGEVMDGEMRLNKAGEIVTEEWLKTSAVRPHVVLDQFMVMPNHFHGIMVIHHVVGARRCLAHDRTDPNQNVKHEQRATHRVAPTGVISGSVGAIIGQFKSLATKRINQMRDNPGQPVWQRNYYEHVIRNDDDLAKIRQYIADNPLKWDLDENNPANAGMAQM